MAEHLPDCAAILLSYLLGSIPSGLWLGRWLRGVDIREHGSKNIGATNTLRVLGKRIGGAALVFDILKGLLPVIMISHVGAWEHLPLACGVAAILGHSFSVFLRFRGGKGVATSAGVFLGLAPLPMLAATSTFAVVVASSRMVSAGSIAAAVVLAASVFFVPLSTPIRCATVLVALLIIVKHRGNIQRIMQGVESRF